VGAALARPFRPAFLTVATEVGLINEAGDYAFVEAIFPSRLETVVIQNIGDRFVIVPVDVQCANLVTEARVVTSLLECGYGALNLRCGRCPAVPMDGNADAFAVTYDRRRHWVTQQASDWGLLRRRQVAAVPQLR